MKGGRTNSSPTTNADMIFMGNEKRPDGGGTLFGIKAGASGDISLTEGKTSNNFVVWSLAESGIAMASPLFYDGLLYIADRNMGKLFCCEAATGAVVYPGTKITGAKAFWASPWAFNGKIYCLEEKGTTHVIQAGRSFKELQKNTLENDIFWASTAIANESYVFRGEKAIYCVR
jgi:outer membrane protein assembly factor BamB